MIKSEKIVGPDDMQIKMWECKKIHKNKIKHQMIKGYLGIALIKDKIQERRQT